MPQHSESRSNAGPGARRRRPRLVLVALLLVTVVPILPGRTQPASADELSDARARQAELEDKIAAQKRQVAKLDKLQADLTSEIGLTKTALTSINADLAAIRKQVDRIEASVVAVKREYENLVGVLASLDTQLGQLRREQERKREELRERLDLLAERLRDAYHADRTSMLEILLSSESFTDLLTDVSYSLDVAERDKRLAEQIKRDRETLAALEESVKVTRDQTDQLRRETAAQKLELDRQLADLGAAQAALRTLELETERELATQRAAFAELARNEAALKQAIAEDAKAQEKLDEEIDALVREQQRRGSIPSEYNGTFIWPHEGRITQEFGCTGFPWEPPLGNCANFHRGIDIAAPRWTPVRAAADGVVVFAGPNPYEPYPKAWIVIIAHSSAIQTWYAHVDNERPPTVRAGEWVKQGQVIAYVGSTGRSTGYHTDWRVELRGEFVNPRRFL